MSTEPVWMAGTDQDGVDFLLRDLLHPVIPIPGGCLPILLVDVCARVRPAAVCPRGRLKFLEELPKRSLELFGCGGVRVLHVGCYRSVSPMGCAQTGATRTGWPRPLAQETDERTVYSGQPRSWVHVATRIVVYVCLLRSTNPPPRHRLRLPVAAKTE